MNTPFNETSLNVHHVFATIAYRENMRRARTVFDVDYDSRHANVYAVIRSHAQKHILARRN
jgi:hypothetical protein